MSLHNTTFLALSKNTTLRVNFASLDLGHGVFCFDKRLHLDEILSDPVSRIRKTPSSSFKILADIYPKPTFFSQHKTEVHDEN